MDRIPKSLAVIDCEYPSIFMALGVRVTLVDGRDRLLPFLDSEISAALHDRLQQLGMDFWFNDRPVKVENSSHGATLHMKSGKILQAKAALFAAKAGLALNDRGYISVDENYRAAVSNVYAAGDVIGFPALASTSVEQGRVAICHAFGFKYKQRVASMLPMGISTIPEISAAGETKDCCQEKKIPYCVGRARSANNARGHIAGDTSGLLKLVFSPEDKSFSASASSAKTPPNSSTSA
jgi:NAD(P) transhydrogenase